MICGWNPLITKNSLKNIHFICRDFSVKMLYYIKIHESEGLDTSEGQDCVRDTNLKSRKCNSCHFYFYHKMNFNYIKSVCNGCYHCMQYKKENYMMIFRVLYTKIGAFRTVSDYFLVEAEKLLEESDLNERFGWLYKDKSNENEHDQIMEDFSEIEVEVGSSCGIELQSLKNECLAIRP